MRWDYEALMLSVQTHATDTPESLEIQIFDYLESYWKQK